MMPSMFVRVTLAIATDLFPDWITYGPAGPKAIARNLPPDWITDGLVGHVAIADGRMRPARDTAKCSRQEPAVGGQTWLWEAGIPA